MFPTSCVHHQEDHMYMQFLWYVFFLCLCKQSSRLKMCSIWTVAVTINPLNAELNPIWYLLALLGAHNFLHVGRIRVKSLTLRQLMSYIYGAPSLDVSRSHTTTQHSRQDSSGRVISSSQRLLPDNKRHSQHTNIHAPGGIRTHDLSRRAACGRSPAQIVGSNPTGGIISFQRNLRS